MPKGCRWANKRRLFAMEDLSGVIHGYRVGLTRKLKSKLYKPVVKTTMVYESACWALRKQEEQLLQPIEMKMLRWSKGKTRKDIDSFGCFSSITKF